MLGLYTTRWKVKLFYKIFKFGNQSEENSLRTADRLLGIYCILLILTKAP